MKLPAIHVCTECWLRTTGYTHSIGASGRYVPARPLPYYGRFQRLKAAWLVFIGRADALMWEEGQ